MVATTALPDKMNRDDIHPDCLDLIAHARGALAVAEAEAVGLHCVLCDRCRAEVEAIVLLRRVSALPVRAPERSPLLMPSVVTVQ